MKGLSPIEQMPVVMLLITIAVLFAISYLVTGAYLKGSREVTFEIKSDSLDKQYLFWLGIIVPIGIFFYLEYFVFLSNEINFDSAGFSIFFDESKLPLGVLALSPIFGVIVSNIHRTIQTEKQISVSEQKNISDSFYAHHKFIIDEFKSISEKYGDIDKGLVLTVSSPNALYKKIYKNSNISNGANDRISNEFLHSLNSYLDLILFELASILHNASNIKTSKNNDFIKMVQNLSELIDESLKYFHIQCGEDKPERYLIKKLSKKIIESKKNMDEINKNQGDIIEEIKLYQRSDIMLYMIENIVFYIWIVINTIDKILDIINLTNLDGTNEIKKLVTEKYYSITNELSEEVIKLYEPIQQHYDSNIS
ncbi:hypothetical protein EX227_03440 [Providencia rettgeri]|uniref:Uncharacterized protein n=1 Tax=Providencia rettgeri TaxID=587 RepID=A0AAP2JXN2_PRORE|nr:hypothetical protein [Providencia rettgeri]EMB3080660.1 hypothetical protein [Providencia rettgeri]MBX6956595.1 hypothetical protein [Providencia rettgeri]MBX6960369.1 hypothetical protein [Providencia rettgeri]MBX6970773.1 hypothetical protein [Providencia rettgeri]MBX6979988.1 hypothetical protein [Providencia rettgeri]